MAIVTPEKIVTEHHLGVGLAHKKEGLLDDALADQVSIMKKQCFHFQGFHGDPCLINSHHILARRKSSLLKASIEHCGEMNHRQQCD